LNQKQKVKKKSFKNLYNSKKILNFFKYNSKFFLIKKIIKIPQNSKKFFKNSRKFKEILLKFKEIQGNSLQFLKILKRIKKFRKTKLIKINPKISKLFQNIILDGDDSTLLTVQKNLGDFLRVFFNLK
jgi:hypothetical protein